MHGDWQPFSAPSEWKRASATIDPAATSGDAADGGTAGADGATTGDSSSSSDGGTGADGFVPEACTPHTIRCQGAQLQICEDFGTGWNVDRTCETSALCEAHDGGECALPACKTGDTRCTSNKFERCNTGRTAFDTLKTCATSAQCFADGGADGGCAAPACSPGELMCSPCPGNTANDCLMVCKSDQTGFEIKQDCGYAQPTDKCVDNQCI